MGQPQGAIQAGPGRSAIFLVLNVGPSEGDAAQVCQACAAVPGLVRAVGHRDDTTALSCVVSIGADAWERLMPGLTRPAQLHPFGALENGTRIAPSTGGDLLFHIRAERQDFCQELMRAIMARLGSAVEVADEVQGFVYMDNRDLIGFVDGTENPAGEERLAATIVGDEDAEHAGGSYVTIQRYVTDFGKWQSVSTEEQEAVIGRTKIDDIELTDERCLPTAHKERAKIVRGGVEQKILRHNRPWGSARESGTFFIAYARDLSVTEEMLRRMFVADEAGVYDHLLDFSHPVTGANFFAPSSDVLEGLADLAAPDERVASVGEVAADLPSSDLPAAEAGSLGIGSLRGRGSA